MDLDLTTSSLRTLIHSIDIKNSQLEDSIEEALYQSQSLQRQKQLFVPFLFFHSFFLLFLFTEMKL